MSLDYIFAFFFSTLEVFENGKKKTDFSITKKFYRGNSQTLKILIPAWGNGKSLIDDILIHRLLRKDHSCLIYSFPKEILCENPEYTKKFFLFAKKKIRADITFFKNKFNFEKIEIIAPSLGVVTACLLANGNEKVSKLFLIVPGNCLASSLWNGIRTKKLRRIYQNKNFDEKKLQKEWANISPENNINDLGNKKVFIALSRTDRVIPFFHGERLAQKMRHQLPDVFVEKNLFLGHYLTVLKYYLFSDRLIK